MTGRPEFMSCGIIPVGEITVDRHGPIYVLTRSDADRITRNWKDYSDHSSQECTDCREGNFWRYRHPGEYLIGSHDRFLVEGPCGMWTAISSAYCYIDAANTLMGALCSISVPDTGYLLGRDEAGQFEDFAIDFGYDTSDWRQYPEAIAAYFKWVEETY